MSPRHPLTPRFAAVALLLILGWLQFSTLAVTSPTMDEPNHLVSGYAFLTRGDTRIKLNGPILPNAIGALPLLLEPKLDLTPADDPRWDANDYNDIADQFVWSNTASPFRIIYMARVPFMMIGWLLGALIFRWARERGGSRAGLFALALYVFCPNLLAHSRFVMTDFAPTAFACFALYAFDRSMRRPDSRAWRLTTGIALGLSLASKFSLIMIAVALPILLAIEPYHSNRRLPTSVGVRRILRRLVPTVTVFFIAAVTVWGVYAFQIGPPSPGGVPVPAPGFWREWESAGYYLNQPWPNYLFGQTSSTGWWYYFPIAFVLKTPVPVLVLLVIAVGLTILKRSWQRDLIFLLPSLLLFLSLLFSTNNLGYRYLLPLLPLVFVYVADLVATLPTQVGAPDPITLSPLYLVVLGLLTWHIVGTLRVYPYYLTFFNEIAGGPDRGRYILSDSNIDWGQDLVGLKQYVDQHGIERIKLSYFGIAHPAAYNLKTEALPPVRTAMHDQGAWWLHTYYPPDPPPGIYAISVANLMGGIWIDQNAYTYFRDRKPDTTIGNSIYIYAVPARGDPADLLLSGLQVDQIDPDTNRRFGTNDVRPRWFDAATSLIAPPGKAWVALAEAQPLAPELAGLFEGVAPEARARTADTGQPYRLYVFDLGARVQGAANRSEHTAAWSAEVYPAPDTLKAVMLPVEFGRTARLLGYQIMADPPAGIVSVVTLWQAGDQIVMPLQLFVHAIAPAGQVIAQQDRLDAPAYGWRAGDVIAQVNRMKISPGAGPVWIEVGLYNADSGDRLPVIVEGREVDHRLLLKQIDLK